jgi:hypothetical protein
MVIEGIGDADAGALHNGEAGRINSRQLMQIGTSKVFPGLLQVG